jgi:hypothetical protein
VSAIQSESARSGHRRKRLGVEQVLDRREQAAPDSTTNVSGELRRDCQTRSSWVYALLLARRSRGAGLRANRRYHRKPGYDPAELFPRPVAVDAEGEGRVDLAKKAIGFRYLMEVILLDATLVRGSYGRVTDRPEDGPRCLSSEKDSRDRND